MFDIVVSAHGDLASSLVRAAEGMLGPLEGVHAVDLSPGDDTAELRRRIEGVIEGRASLVLCDLYGGTPANACLLAPFGSPVEVVAGVNLPMLPKAAGLRSQPLVEAAEKLVQYGRLHVRHQPSHPPSAPQRSGGEP